MERIWRFTVDVELTVDVNEDEFDNQSASSKEQAVRGRVAALMRRLQDTKDRPDNPLNEAGMDISARVGRCRLT